MSTSALLPILVAALATAAPSPTATPTSTPSTALRVLVAPSGDAAVDGAVRAGVGGEGVVLVDAATTASVLVDARAVGVVCAASDGACWWRLAELGGFDVAVFVVGDVVTKQTATSTSTATAAHRSVLSWTSATRRLFGVAGEVRIRAQPANAGVTVDDVAVVDVVTDDGVAVASVPPGAHRVLVRAPGFVDSESTVGVSAGVVVDVSVALVPQTTTASSWAPSVRDGGLGVLALTAATVGGLVAWGQVPYLACYDARPPAGCAADGDITTTANTTAAAAVVVGAVGVVVGGGAIVVGIVNE